MSLYMYMNMGAIGLRYMANIQIISCMIANLQIYAYKPYRKGHTMNIA